MSEPTESGDLLQQAKQVLVDNDRGQYTVPAAGLYPHQWLWDSCFIALGQRHYDLDRAKAEILSLFRGQWANGMLPSIILSSTARNLRHGNIWYSWINPASPDDVVTSGITQPPMLAEAIVGIGQKLPKAERRLWYRQVYPKLLKFHKWIYSDRDPHGEGLALLIHPWESGLDNTPPWMAELHQHVMPDWVKLIAKARLEWVVNLFRKDVKYVPVEQRVSTIEALVFYSVQRRLRRKRYDINQILPHSLFAIEDLTYNCILIRANQHLQKIAKTIKQTIEPELLESMAKTEAALSGLWDPYSNQYYSRNFVTHKLIKEPTIATLMPLYAGCISQERADKLVKMLQNEQFFDLKYPVPTVPLNSPWFKASGYWQGPTWINTNWLIIDGLKRSGHKEQATALAKSTLKLVEEGGFNEYFNPQTGEAAGAPNFSWTAALVIDLLKETSGV